MLTMKMIIMLCIVAWTFRPDCRQKDVKMSLGKWIGVLCCPDGNFLFENEKITARAGRFTGCNDHAVQADEKNANKAVQEKGGGSRKVFSIIGAMILTLMIVAIR